MVTFTASRCKPHVQTLGAMKGIHNRLSRMGVRFEYGAYREMKELYAFRRLLDQ